MATTHLRFYCPYARTSTLWFRLCRVRDEAQRLFIVVGGAGIGKTTMVCRLLKAIARGRLLDGIGQVRADGIVYLSAIGSRRISAPNMFEDLCKLLPEDKARRLQTLLNNAQVRTEDKMKTLLGEFSQGCTVVLLDNFEDLINEDDQQQMYRVRDAELDEALRALLDAAPHAVKVIMTTQIAPDALMLLQPGRQGLVDLDPGLPSPHAENVLRAMDVGNQLGLQSAPAELLTDARTRTDGHPRALEAIYSVLFADRTTTIDDLLRNTRQILPAHVCAILVGKAFDRQDPKCQCILKALAVYGRPVSSAAVNYLIHSYLPGVDSEPVLRRLVKTRLARKVAGLYSLHPIDRTYALSQVPRGEARDRLQSGPPNFTQIGLLDLAAEYFKHNRKRQGVWRTSEDLNPQLAEFDLRCAGKEYETAARVLIDVDIEYLTLWGQSPMVVAMYEQLLGNLANSQLRAKCRIDDPQLRGRCLYGLGFAQYYLARYEAAISSLERAMAIARSAGNLKDEGLCLAYLGNCNFYLGRISEAIAHEQKALDVAAKIEDQESDCLHLRLLANGRLGACFIFTADDDEAAECLMRALDAARGTHDRRDENFFLDVRGLVHCYQGQYEEAFGLLDRAQAIAKEIGDSYGLSMHACNRAEMLNIQGNHKSARIYANEALKIGYGSLSPVFGSWSNVELARALLRQGNAEAAYAAASAACKHDAPMNNHTAFAMLGVVTLRLADFDEARKAFVRSIELADGMLHLCAQNYYALTAKGLALSGLVLCGEKHRKTEAIQAYEEARQLSTAPGRLRQVLLMFDALTDPDNLLEEVRQAAADA